MSDPADFALGRLQIDLARQIDAVCRKFEAEWREGKEIGLGAYLADVPQQGRPALRAELEALERELRQSDETVVPAEPPTQPTPGEARLSKHEDATVPPTDQATLDHAPGSTAIAPEPSLPRSLFRRLRDHSRDRPRRHGGRLPARQVSLNRPVALKMILAGQLANETESSGSTPRPRRRRTSIIPASCRSTRSASTRASIISRWGSLRGRASPNAWPRDRCLPARRPK